MQILLHFQKGLGQLRCPLAPRETDEMFHLVISSTRRRVAETKSAKLTGSREAPRGARGTPATQATPQRGRRVKVLKENFKIHGWVGQPTDDGRPSPGWLGTQSLRDVF